jgi:hypothetical protein
LALSRDTTALASDSCPTKAIGGEHRIDPSTKCP